MQLIDNASSAYKMASIWAFVSSLAVQVAAISVPPELLAMLPPNVAAYVSAGLAVAGIIARLVKQNNL